MIKLINILQKKNFRSAFAVKVNFRLAILLLLGWAYSNIGVAQIGGPTGSGSWSPVYDMPLIPVAMANLPDGKVLCWSAKDRDGFGGGGNRTYTSVYDPSDNSFTDVLVTVTGHDMFCPGTNNLADGRVLVAGGQNSEKTSIYDWQTESWVSGPTMQIPRGYQANATLSDGSLFTIGGSWSGGRGNKDGEVYTEAGGWRILSNVKASETVEEGTQGYSSEGVYRTDNHAWVWEAPNGRIFHAGPGEQMHWIDVAGNGNVDDAGPRGTDEYSMNGSALMYDIGKIFKTGGAVSYASNDVSTGESYTIDINGNTPIVTRVDDLTYNRTMCNAVVLPTGEVFVVGGLRDAKIFTDQNARMIPEVWNPTTGNFRSLAPMAVPRTYHSAAILLPDGRVLVGGGGLSNNNPSVNHADVEIYSPSYLFNTNGTPATRPQINTSPDVADHNTSITVTTNTAVSEFSLVRLGSATHSVNNEQRRVPLNISGTSGTTYTLDIPNASIAVPGYYMLFAIENGVPSVSKAIRIGNGQNGPGGTVQIRYSSQIGNIPGTIEAEFFDLGGQGIAYNEVDNGKFGDSGFRPGENVDANILSGSNYKVGWTANGEWLEYTVDAQSGNYDIIVTASSGSTGAVGDLQLSLDGVNLGVADITSTGSWFTTQDFTISNVDINGGNDKVLRLTIVNGESFDIDKVTFVRNLACDDDDNDGVCNADDVCPNFDDNLIGTACDDGDICTVNDVYGTACGCAGTYADSDNDGTCDALDDCNNNIRVLADESFNGSLGNATTESGAFSSPKPNYESVSFQGGQINLGVGGVDNTTQTDISLAVKRNFFVPESSATEISITYTLNVAAGYDADEYTDVLLSLDGQMINYSGNPYLYRIVAGSPTSSGAQNVTIALGNLSTGNHEIILGVFNNKKTFNGESSSLLIDQITITQACADCDGSLAGTACDDGEACTTNDVYDANCNCLGTFQDSDGDGVCDADDQCPNFDDNLIGTACDDGDACTINDVIGTDCNCAGTYTDSDNDGICDTNDTCPNLDDSLIGTACDDGDACTINDTYQTDCGCVGTFVDSDSDGVCDADDLCPNFDDALIGTACDDGDPNTSNDIYTSNCTCEGSVASQTDFWLEAECAEVGSAWTLINDNNASEGEALTFTGTNSTGSAPTAASARVRFNINITQAGSYEIFARSIAPNGGDDSYWVRANNGNWVRFNKVNGLNQNNSYQWDQVGEWATGAADNVPVSFNLPVGATTIDFAYRENGIKFDKAFVTLDQGAPSGLGATAENCSLSCTPGTACNDGNACTINDQFDNNCNCVGTLQDNDGDGVCDADDQCPNFDDGLIGTACDDGDANTINDVYTTACICEGTISTGTSTIELTPIDDAYLQGSTLFNTDELRIENGNRVTYMKFDLSGVSGTITDAELQLKVGSDAGNGTVIIQEGDSNNWTENNLSNSNKPNSIGQIGSKSGTYASQSVHTADLNNFSFNGSQVSLIVVHNSGNDMSFKSSENSDVAGRPKLTLTVSTSANSGIEARTEATKTISIYPNPANDILSIKGVDEESLISVIDISGRVLIEAIGQPQLDISELSAGIYFIKVNDAILKFVKE
ncbi:MAG: galactose oxidase-like domain-containing protein [Bacteroidota bacterium]